MTLSKDDIIEIMTKARELGVHHFKGGGFEASFSFQTGPNLAVSSYIQTNDNEYGNIPIHPSQAVSVFPSTVKDEKFEDLIKPVSPFDELTEDEILYWGTAHGDELIAKRKAREEELKTETRATGRNRSKPQGDSDVQESPTQ